MAFNWFGLRKTKEAQVGSPRSGFGVVGGVYVSEEGAMNVAAFYRGAIYLATTIAKMPWYIKDKTNTIIDNDLSFLLNDAPNPEMTAMRFRIQAVLNAIQSGNAYAEIERNWSGRPIALWPIPSSDCAPIRDRDGKLWYKLTGNSSREGMESYLEAGDVLHLTNLHTMDGIVGQGVVAYARTALGIAIGADRISSGLMGNGGLPSGVLKAKGVISDEAYTRMLDSWREQHSGGKAGGVAILEEGVEFEALNLDPQTLQMLDSKKFGVLEIARFLGLPPQKLFDMSTATANNVENANLDVIVDTIGSWASMLEGEADIKILNKKYGGNYTELDIYSISRGDMNTRSNYFSKMMQVGAITPNQIRMSEGMAPYKGGDRFYIAVNNYTPSDRLDEVIDAQIANKAQPKAGSLESGQDENQNPEEKEAKKIAAQLSEAALDYLRK